MAKGTEEHFQSILSELTKNFRRLENNEIKHIQWCDQITNIFKVYGWDKASFYQELNARLGIKTPNQEAIKKKKSKAAK
jgi:hypothetical protein